MHGVLEMKISHKGMLDAIEKWLFYELEDHNEDTPKPIKITQNSQTKEFIIQFENEDAVKSILPPMGE
jgi:hypothetical protein